MDKFFLLNALESDNEVVRAAAIRALTDSHDETIFVAMCHENPRIRSGVATVLGNWGGRDAIAALIDALGSPAVEVRRAAAEALGRIGAPRAVEPLVNVLGSDKEPSVCRAAAEALGRIGDKRVTNALIGALGSPAVEVRRAAAKALWRIGDPSAVDALMDHLGDRDNATRHHVVETVGELAGEQHLPRLREALVGEAKSHAYSVITRMAQRNIRPAFDTLVEMAGNEEDYGFLAKRAMRALAALGRDGNWEAIAVLIDLHYKGKEGVERLLASIIAP